MIPPQGGVGEAPTGILHPGGLVFAYAEHTVDDIFFAVGVLDIAVDPAEGEGVVDVDDEEVHGHIEGVRDLEADVDAAVLVVDAPGLCLTALALEDDGGQREALAFHPDEVFVVGVLIDGLVAGEVECEIFFLAVDVAPAHGGEPVVVGEVGVIALVVVDDGDGILVGDELLAVDHDIPGRLEEVLLGIEGLVGAEGDGHVGGRGEPLHGHIDLKAAAPAFRPAFGGGLAVHEVVFDDILALFDFELAIVVHELGGDFRLLDGHDVAPLVDLAAAFVEPNEDGEPEGTRVVHRGHQRALVKVHFECLPFRQPALFHEIGHQLSARLLALDEIEFLERFVKRAEMRLSVLHDAVGSGDGAAFLGNVARILAHSSFLLLPIN